MTLLSILRAPSNQIGSTLADYNFDADIIGNVPTGWTAESGTSWQVVSAPAGLSGRCLLATTDASFDHYLRTTFTRQTDGIISIGWTVLTNSVVGSRSGVMTVYDTSGAYVCQVGPLNSVWVYGNSSGVSGSVGSYVSGQLYRAVVHIDMDQKKFKFQVGTSYYDNAGAWWDLTTGTTGIDRIKFSLYAPPGGSFYIDDVQIGKRIPAAVAPTTTGTLSTSGVFGDDTALLRNNTFNGGSNATTITTGNSGGASGDAFDAVTGSPTFTSAQSQEGGMAMAVTNPAALTSANWTGLGSLTSPVFFRTYIYLSGLPATNRLYAIRILNAAGADCAMIRILSTGSVSPADASNSGFGADSSAIPTGQWIRLELRIVPSTTVGELHWRIFNTPTSTVADQTGGATGLALAANVGEIRVGAVQSPFPTGSFTAYYDGLGVDTANWIGPMGAGYALGPDRFGRIVLGYANADSNASSIRMERSNDNTNWADIGGAQQKTIVTAAGQWVVIDRRPQYGAESTTYGGTVYYRVSAFNSGGASPTSASGAMTSNVDITAYETARFAALSSIMAGGSVPSSAGGEAYPTYWLGAMAYAYAKTGNSTYLTDVQNQWDYIKTLDAGAHGCVQLPDYTDWIYRDHHWRTVLWTAAVSRLLRNYGATTLANDMVAQADTWVAAFAALMSGAPRATTTIQGFDANDDSTANVQRVWTASTAYSIGDIVTPTVRNGRTYRVTVAGTSSGVQPTWPTTNGASVSLNGVTYVDTTTTGAVTYSVYSTTAPYDGLAGEALVDMNQNGEEAAALALLTSDPTSALFSAGAARTAALQVITDVTALLSAFATSTGAIPIGQTYAAINGPEGYDTLYGAYTLEVGALTFRYAPAQTHPYYDEMLVRGLGWLTANYSTEPISGMHYSGLVGTYASELLMREYPYASLSVSNPVVNLRYTAATNDPALERPVALYDANGAATADVDAHAARSFTSDQFLQLLVQVAPEVTGIASAGAMGTPTVATTSTVTGIATAGALGTPTLTQAATVTGIATAGAMGTPTVATTSTVTGIAAAGAMGTPSTLTAATVTGIATGEALGVPSVATASTVTGIASGEAMGSPTATEIAGNPAIVDGIASAEALGTPTAVTGTAAAVTGIASAGALGVPTVATMASPTGIASAGALGNPTVVLGQAPQVVAIPSGEAMGNPTSMVVASFALNVAGFFDEGTVLYLYAEPDVGFFLRAAPSLRYRRDEPSIMPLPPPITTVPVSAGAASFPAIEGGTTYVVASTSGRVLRFRTP